MTTLTSKLEKYFTTTLLEAEGLVSQMKKEHGTLIKQHSITKRQKKDVEFFVVTILVEYYKVNDLVVTD